MAYTRLARLINGGHGAETEHRSIKQTEEQGPNLDNCGLFAADTAVQSDGASTDKFVAVAPTCQMSEFERFKSGSGVSLTLGLQHCEGSSFLPGETHPGLVFMREDEIYSATAASTGGLETKAIECICAGNQRQRFSSPHMLHDL